MRVKLHQIQRRVLSGLVGLAVLFAALAPALSHALATTSGSRAWVEICSAMGSRWVAVDPAAHATGDNPSPAPVVVIEHCAICASSAHGMAPPSVGRLEVPALSVGVSLPERVRTEPIAASFWRSAQPRGPPALA